MLPIEVGVRQGVGYEKCSINPRFHKTGDRPETLDYAGLELAVEAAWAVLRSVTAIRRGPPTS